LDVYVVLDQYAAILGREALAPKDVRGDAASCRYMIITYHPLTREQLISAVETLLRIHSIRTELVGDKQVRFTLAEGPRSAPAPSGVGR
jgi:hypothetical protein